MNLKKNIVVFRASGPIQNNYLIKRLKLLNFKVTYFPILKVKKIYKKQINLYPDDIILTTSFYGVYYIAKLTKRRNCYIYCLGKATFLLAKKLGFKNIIECNGDSANMVSSFINNKCFNMKRGNIIYAGAKEISYNLPKNIERLGYKVIRYKIYSSDAVDSFTKNFIKLVKNRKVSWIVLLSAKGAKVFYKNSKRVFNKDDLSNLKFACISANVAKHLKAKYFKTFFPKYPNTDFIINTISNDEKNYGT